MSLPAEFVFLGEHPALDFANTYYAPHGEMVDELRSWTNVVEWLRQAKLAENGDRLGVPTAGRSAALAQVIELRDLWSKQVAGLLAGKKVSGKLVTSLNAALEKDRFNDVLEPGAESRFRIIRSASQLEGVDLALALVSREIASFLVECNLDYLRQCAGHDCVLYFYDTTKNHRRQWCSAAACGNRAKVAAFRERQAARNQASS